MVEFWIREGYKKHKLFRCILVSFDCHCIFFYCGRTNNRLIETNSFMCWIQGYQARKHAKKKKKKTGTDHKQPFKEFFIFSFLILLLISFIYFKTKHSVFEFPCFICHQQNKGLYIKAASEIVYCVTHTYSEFLEGREDLI